MTESAWPGCGEWHNEERLGGQGGLNECSWLLGGRPTLASCGLYWRLRSFGPTAVASMSSLPSLEAASSMCRHAYQPTFPCSNQPYPPPPCTAYDLPACLLEVCLRYLPAEFERAAGRAAAKKWKTSLRIDKGGGQPGITLQVQQRGYKNQRISGHPEAAGTAISIVQQCNEVGQWTLDLGLRTMHSLHHCPHCPQ